MGKFQESSGSIQKLERNPNHPGPTVPWAPCMEEREEGTAGLASRALLRRS